MRRTVPSRMKLTMKLIMREPASMTTDTWSRRVMSDFNSVYVPFLQNILQTDIERQYRGGLCSVRLQASAHYTSRKLYNSASQDQSWEQGGGGTRVYWWYGDVPLWRPPFSNPDFRSLDTTHNRNSVQKTPITKHLRFPCLYQNSWVVARDCSPRSSGLKTPENSSLHCSLANLRCVHVTEVIMYNVLHYPISFSAPSLHSKIGNIVFRVVRCRSESRSFSLRTPVTHVHRV